MSDRTSRLAAATGWPVDLRVVSSELLGRRARTEIIRLCEAAYGESFAQLFNDLPDSVHILARDASGLLVSHVEWVPRWLQPAGHGLLRTAYVEAVATSPAHQRRGLASGLLRRFQEIVRDDSTWELAALSPSDSAFYARLGWELWEGPLGIRHDDRIEPAPSDEAVMILTLPRSPATLVNTSIDDDFRAWLREAYLVGDQRHLKPRLESRVTRSKE